MVVHQLGNLVLEVWIWIWKFGSRQAQSSVLLLPTTPTHDHSSPWESLDYLHAHGSQLDEAGLTGGTSALPSPVAHETEMIKTRFAALLKITLLMRKLVMP